MFRRGLLSLRELIKFFMPTRKLYMVTLKEQVMKLKAVLNALGVIIIKELD